jgi:hypothetical protein
MPRTLIEQFREAGEELAAALNRAKDPAFETGALDPALVARLQVAVAAVERATAEASTEERAEAQSHPACAKYKDRLTELHAALVTWRTRLLAYRAQLDRKNQRVAAARHWAEAYNRTR